MDNITATRSHGRVQLAQDIHWYGNINSYNNGFTRFFAKLFRKTVTVDISGKNYCLNKKSYRKHLLKLQAISDKKANVKTLNTYQTAIGHLAPEQLPKNGLMRERIEPKKQEKLFHKVLKAIKNQDETRAARMIKKGAKVNEGFYSYSGQFYPQSRNEFLGRILPVSTHKTTFSELTPLLAAAERGLRETSALLIRVGAGKNAVGKEIEITRQITDIDTKNEVHNGTAIAHRPNPHHPDGRREATVVQDPYVEKKTYKLFEDTEKELYTLHYKDDHSIEKKVGTTPPITRKGRSLIDRSTQRIGYNVY